MRTHFAEVYTSWALLIYPLALPALYVCWGISAGLSRLFRRRGTAYLGEWPGDD